MISSNFISTWKFFLRPYPFYSSSQQARNLVLAISIFIGLFCLIFQPFVLYKLDTPLRYGVALGYGGVTFVVCTVQMVLLPRLLPRLFDKSRWTVIKEVIWVAWIFLNLGFFNYYYSAIFFRLPDMVESFGTVQLFTILVGSLPAIGIILYKQIVVYKIEASKALPLTIEAKDSEPSRLVFCDTAGRAILRIDQHELLYIISAGNYVEVFFRQNERKSRQVIRNKISAMEELLEGYPAIIRCHRSYIVNMDCVSSLQGRSPHYKLMMPEVENGVPVAKRQVKAVKALLMGGVEG